MANLRSLRVLHLIDSGGLYGAERVLLALSSECQKLGHDPIVGTMVAPSDHDDPLGVAARKLGIRQVRFLVEDGFRLAWLQRALRFIRQERVDIVHTHGYRPNVMLAMVPRRSVRCPILTTLHGWTAMGQPGKLAAYEWLERLFLPRLDGVVIVSEAIRQHLPNRIREDARLVLNGIDFGVYDSVARPVRSSDKVISDAGAHRSVLAAGRLSREKGLDVLLDAVALLRDDGLAIRLVCAGTGPEQGRLEERAKDLGLNDNVEFRTFVKEMAPLYAQADLLVIPSRREGLPLVLLEAMAAELPVVATRVGQVPKVLDGGSCGWLVEPGSARELAAAMRLALEDYEQSIIYAKRARSSIRENYSAKKMAERYVEFYQVLSE